MPMTSFTWVIVYTVKASFKKPIYAVAGVAQWIECPPANQQETSSSPSLGHMLGLWARSPVGGAREETTH